MMLPHSVLGLTKKLPAQKPGGLYKTSRQLDAVLL
jgi:hypothetical protein